MTADKNCIPINTHVSGSTDDSNNIESSMNTVFIPELGHEEFVLQRQYELGSPDVVSLREGLGTSDGPTHESCFSKTTERIKSKNISFERFFKAQDS